MAIAKRCADAEEDPWNAHSSMMKWASRILLAIIFLIVLGVSTIWLTVHPRQLDYAVTDALVTQFKLTDNGLLTANFSINMSTNNNNHQVSFTYEDMRVEVKSHDQIIASAIGPHLFHNKDNFTEFHINLVSQDKVLQGPTLKDLKDQKQSGDIKIDVIINARVKFKALHWKQDHCKIQIFCGDVVGHFSRDKSFQQTPCDVEL